MLNQEWEWLETWMKDEQLELDVIPPHGVQPKVSDLLNWTALVSLDKADIHYVTNMKSKDIKVRSCDIKGIPVFSSGWRIELDIKNNATTSMNHFLDFSFDEFHTHASKWDPTFINAETLTSHGDSVDLKTCARLVRWHFKMPFPFMNREMLFLAIPIVLSSRQVIISFLSVKSLRFPCLSGYCRAYNNTPSFDYASIINDKMIINHFLTTRIGGWISDRFVWNPIFKSSLIKVYEKEGKTVRNLFISNFRLN